MCESAEVQFTLYKCDLTYTSQPLTYKKLKKTFPISNIQLSLLTEIREILSFFHQLKGTVSRDFLLLVFS